MNPVDVLDFMDVEGGEGGNRWNHYREYRLGQLVKNDARALRDFYSHWALQKYRVTTKTEGVFEKDFKSYFYKRSEIGNVVSTAEIDSFFDANPKTRQQVEAKLDPWDEGFISPHIEMAMKELQLFWQWKLWMDSRPLRQEAAIRHFSQPATTSGP